MGLGGFNHWVTSLSVDLVQLFKTNCRLFSVVQRGLSSELLCFKLQRFHSNFAFSTVGWFCFLLDLPIYKPGSKPNHILQLSASWISSLPVVFHRALLSGSSVSPLSGYIVPWLFTVFNPEYSIKSPAISGIKRRKHYFPKENHWQHPLWNAMIIVLGRS